MNKKIIAASGLSFIIIISVFYTLQNDTDIRNSVKESLIEMELKEQVSRPYSQDDNTPQAYFAYQTSINQIIADQSLVDSGPLPDELLILPGYYTFQDLNYNLTTDLDALIPFIPEFIWVYHTIIPIFFLQLSLFLQNL